MAADANKETIKQAALKAKTDEHVFAELVRENKRFILNCAYKTTGRYVTDSDDEWSICLIAFHEAVNSYDAGKGDFLQFAALVMRRRLLDYKDREARQRSEISVDLSGGDLETEEDVTPIRLEVRKKTRENAVWKSQEQTSLRDEIEAIAQVLSGYGIGFPDLARTSPKAQKTKTACGAVIRALITDAELMEHLRSSRSLPVKRICETTKVPQNILDKHRKYIIAGAEILFGDFPHLAEYLHYVGGR